MFRKQFVERGNLPWPTSRATAELISTLHRSATKKEELTQAVVPPLPHFPEPTLQVPQREYDRDHEHTNTVQWQSFVKRHILGAVGSGVVVCTATKLGI